VETVGFTIDYFLFSIEEERIMKVRSKINSISPLSAGIMCLLLASIGAAQQISLTGGDFSAWRAPTGQWQVVGDAFTNLQDEKSLSSKSGTGVILNGPTGKTSHLFSKAEFGDIKAHVEFMIPKGSNSGIYFMGRYEIQVYDSYGVEKDEYPGIECGGIYQRWDENRDPKGYEGHSPRVNASRPPGQWQTFDVVFRAPRFDAAGQKIANARLEKVVYNGVVIHEDVELTGPTRASAYNDEKPTGPLMLQGDHGPVAYRNIRIEPAGPDPFFAMDTATDSGNLSAAQQVEMVRNLGYAGMGCTAGKGLAEMQRELDKNGLRLFTAYLGVSIDPGQEKYGPELKDAIEVMEGRNAILWLFVQSKIHKPSSPAGDERAVEIIREVADMAAKAGLRVALYPHYGFWCQRVEDAVRVAKKVDRRNVGVTFNLCHWLRVDDEKNLKPLLESAMPYLFVVTINGADSGGKGWKELIQTLDRGSFDMGGFLKTLTDSGYTGPIGFQGYGIGGDTYENLKRTMDAWLRLNGQAQ
jgi:sugar phosphate isomerase/epimerase